MEETEKMLKRRVCHHESENLQPKAYSGSLQMEMAVKGSLPLLPSVTFRKT